MYEDEDENCGSDIEWLHAIENSSLYVEFFGNLDNNGSLGISDLNIILAEFGCNENCAEDFNDDSSSTIVDLLFWLSLFENVC